MQWQRSKNWIYLIFILGFVLTPMLLHANDEEKIQRGIKRLNALIERNAVNDARGESYLNEYVFSLEDSADPDHVFVEPPTFIHDDQLLSDLRKELTDLAGKENIHFYIALNGAMIHVKPIGKNDLNELKYEKLYDEADIVIKRIRLESKLSSIGEGKNVLVGITPVQVVGVDKNKDKDKLSLVYLRTIASGKGYSDFFQIIDKKYKSSFVKYSSTPSDALRNDKNVYINVLRNYDEEKKALLPGSSPPSLQFIDFYKQFATDPAINSKIGEITRLIDKDQVAYKEMLELLSNAGSIMGNNSSVTYRYFNHSFDIIEGLGSTVDNFEAFKQSIITYQNYKNSIVSIADAILCSAKTGETANQFKARVYYCAAILTPASAAELSLETRKKLICALSSLELSGAYSVANDQLTTSEGKEEVILRIMNNTPPSQQKGLLDYILQTPSSQSSTNSIFSNLKSRIDLQNFQDFMLRLSDWIEIYYPNNNPWPKIAEKAFLPVGISTDAYTVGVFYEDNKTKAQLKIRGIFNGQEKSRLTDKIDVKEQVILSFEDDCEIGGKIFKEGQEAKMPALLAYLIMYNMKVKAAKTTGKYTLYAAGLLIGVSEIAAAETAVELTFAIIDTGIAVSDPLMNEVLAETLNRIEDGKGKKWLDAYNKWILIYGTGRIYVELTEISKILNDISPLIRNEQATQIAKNIALKLEQNLANANWPEDAASFVKTIGNDESDVNLVRQWLSNVGDNKTYVAVHGNGGEFRVLYKDNDVILLHRSLARWIEETNSGSKEIVLLTCADARAAQNLVNKLGSDAKIITWEGITEVYANGYIKGEGKCYKYSNSGSADFKREELLGSDIPKGSTASSPSGSKVILGGVNVTMNVFDLSALKNVLAKTPGVDNASLTNLPKSFWDDAYKFTPQTGSSPKTRIDYIVTNGDQSGKLTEELVQELMVTNGYKVGNGRYYGEFETARNGIDGFFYKGDISSPSEIIIIDAKQMNASGAASLNAGNTSTGLPVQMKEDWITYIANQKLTDITNSLQQNTKSAILNSPSGFIKKYVVVVDKSTSEIKFLKLDDNF